MKMTRQDTVYAALGGVSFFVLATAANGSLQKWTRPDFVETSVMLALVSASFACQHALLLCLAALSKRRVQPISWLFRRSRAAIGAVLHLAALFIMAVGVPVGWLISSNKLLALIAGTALTLFLAAELTFRGDIGPLAALLRARNRHAGVE